MLPQKTISISLLSAVIVTLGPPSLAQQNTPRVGVEEHLGQMLPLDDLTFSDETGKTIKLRELFDLPVALTLVYFRCPGICTPLLLEVAKVADNGDLVPGKDYRLVTISFDPTEKADLAKNKKANMLAEFKKKTLPPDAWRFLTGDQKNITAISDILGFYYTKDKNGVDYVHGSTVMFISPDGKISRYLIGTQFNPADLKLAVLDASQGRARSFMGKIQTLCYTYNPDSRGYVLKVNRIILGITLVFALAFGAVLLIKGRTKTGPTNTAEANTGANPS